MSRLNGDATNNGIDSALGFDKHPYEQNGPSDGKIINLPIVNHKISLAYLYDVVIAKLIRIPIKILITLSYCIVHGPITLKRKYNVSRKRINVPSREKGRKIKVDAYIPSNLQKSTKALPLHINWHGSGFVLDCFGADGDFCAYLANKMQCIILDADYRKSPEYPFPACIHDGEDVMNWVFDQNQQKNKTTNHQLPPFDLQNVSVGGGSAGANIALVMGVIFGGKKICAVATIAPPTDFRPEARPKLAPQPNHPRALPRRVTLFFDRCYLIPNIDRSNPILSPVTCNMQKGQLDCKLVYIAAGKGDTLHNDGYSLIQSLKRQGHKNAIFCGVPGEGHGFEKAIGKGEQKQKALAVFDDIVKLIKATWQESNSAEDTTLKVKL